MKVGFVGVGTMGSGMAANILKAGHVLTVNDLRREAAEPLLKSGALWADTPSEAAGSSEIIFTSLPGPPQVEAVALGRSGIIEGIKPGAIYVDVSTNSPGMVRKVYEEFKKKGAHMLDGPVSGGPQGAASGRLAIMVGGDEDIYNRCKPVLDAMGDKVSYTGTIGCGTICKLMHNCINYGITAITAECLTLGVKAGVRAEALCKAIAEGGVGRGGFFQQLLPQIYLAGKFEPPTFALQLAFKDVDLATSLGREYKVPMNIANITYQDMIAAMNRGWGDKDSRVIMLLQEERAGGIEVRSADAKSEEKK